MGGNGPTGEIIVNEMLETYPKWWHILYILIIRFVVFHDMQASMHQMSR